ncbi:MAG TPA: hypothetical protein VFB80_19240, partial [Pirellulaceae bacterium]|nr:hypothetical protein [Pirellulaceae bacterium]
MTQFNGAFYFAAEGTNSSGQNVGRELFRLNADGSTELVADINPGAASSAPGDFAFFSPNGSDRLLFAATGLSGREIYQLDTSGNVTLVADVNPGLASSDPVMLTEFSGKLYFSATTSATGREIYVVNNGGSVSLVADINPGSASSNPSAFTAFSSNLYFTADGPGGRHLYRESPSGTSDPVLVNLGAGVLDPQGFTEFGGKLYFSALDPVDGRELFVLTPSGNNKSETVTKVANLDGTSASSSPGEFFVFDNRLYFAATAANGRELFRLDSSGQITQIDINAGPASSSPSGFTLFDGQLYFAATVGGQRGLFRLSPGAASPVPVSLPSGVMLPQDVVFYAVEDVLFFAAEGPLGRELYRMGPGEIVTLAADVNSGSASSDPAEVIALAGHIYFVASDVTVGRELFVLRQNPSSIRIVGDELVFTDEDGDEDNRLVVSSDGTNLKIRDENGHTIFLFTAIAGATGGGTNEVTIPFSSLAGINALAIDTRGGNDSVTFDLSANADAILGQFATSTYDGGPNSPALPGDRLRFIGDGLTRSQYTPDALVTGSGVVLVSSATHSTSFGFLHLEPVDFTGMSEARLVTPGTGTGSDALVVSPGLDGRDGLISALIVSGTVGGTTIESAHFFGNQTVVIATGSGLDGTDSVTVNGAANGHNNSNLSIDTGTAGQDSVLILGDVTLAGNLLITTNALDVRALLSIGGTAAFATRDDIVFSSAGRLLAPVAALTAGDQIALAAGSLVDAGSGTISLTATGDITLGRLVTTNGTNQAV